jgi:hypothetical protein
MAPLSSCPPFATLTRLRHERSHRQLDVLRNRRQEASFISGDCVSGHSESRSEFLLGEAEEEPLTTQLPTGQAPGRLPEGASAINVISDRRRRLYL